MSEELPKSDPRVVSQAKKSTGYKRDKRKKIPSQKFVTIWQRWVGVMEQNRRL